MSKYYIGQKFLTKKGDYAIIEGIYGNYIYLKYKGKLHKRHNSVIGRKLFVLEKDKLKFKASEIKKSCSNCKYSVRGECIGDGLCDDYVHVPTMTDQDRKNYPKEGDASYIRRTGFSKNG
ncbi:MAG: hypothetical protein H0S78_13870 [Tissierellales bacterium]|jgi:hypothetical protein|nr:hypothetical protein [Tissierellales bacterium]